MDTIERQGVDRELRAVWVAYLDALAERNRTMVEARAKGFSLRRIATIVGLSVETVRKITTAKEESR